MWRVYRRTRKDEDYANYKEALNLATNEIKKSKRTFEKKLAGNINKNESEIVNACVRSKQKVRDKVGPLENNRGNIISDWFHMVKVLNEYLSSLPVPFTKFEGSKSEHLGQLFVIPEMRATKLRRRNIINHRELMGYHKKYKRTLLSKLVHHLQNGLTCH